MKLYYSRTSPYARKVMVCILELGFEKEIEFEILSPLRNTEILNQINPLGKIPCFIGVRSELVLDSPVICRYIDDIAINSGASSLFSSADLSMNEVERVHSLSDGIMDAAVAYVLESARPPEQQSEFWKDRWKQSVLRTIKYISDHEIRVLNDNTLTVGQVALASALAYLDFRITNLDWRSENARISEWLAQILKSPSFIKTLPQD